MSDYEYKNDAERIEHLVSMLHSAQSNAESFRRLAGDEIKKNAALLATARRLKGALRDAKELIRTWHNMDMHGDEADECWALYQESPEMKKLNGTLAAPDVRSLDE